MKNSEKIEFGLIGFIIGGGVFSVLIMPFFIMARIDPMIWFMVAMFLIAPAFALAAAVNAEKVDRWLDK